MHLIAVVIFFALSVKYSAEGVSSGVPAHLMKCYRTNYTSNLLKPPLTVRLLVELIRKVEWVEKDALNLRMFTTSLLHSVRFDGVQMTPGLAESDYLVPYRASGKQFYKYKLLVDYLISAKPQLLPHDSLTTKELCLLHEIISNSVHVWERGNEGRTCPELRSMSYQSPPDAVTLTPKGIGTSKCPIENGVVRTRWGTISPGHLVSGISSALQDVTFDLQRLIRIIQKDKNITSTATSTATAAVDKNLNISNIWVSTVAGDLAEVAVQQAFGKPKLGNIGIWNNTQLPRTHYLKDEPYDMTSAELLGGLDGLIFANKIKEWLSILSRTRFSQLLDMYYSKRGIAYDRSYRACERSRKLAEFLKYTELELETRNVAKLLQELGAADQYLDENALERYAADVVRYFKTEAESIMLKYSACEQEMDDIQPLELITVLDNTWIGYDAQTLVGTLAEAADVGFYGSTLGLINGQTGAWLTSLTDSLVRLYEDIHKAKNMWQNDLILSKSLETVASYVQTKTERTCNRTSRVPRTTVVLVMANSATLNENDIAASKESIKSIKNTYPETKIIYLTAMDNSKSYEDLARLYLDDTVIKLDYDQSIKQKVSKQLATIPSSIVDFYCDNSRFQIEDYVTPGLTRFYEIHGDYLRRAHFSVKFKGNDYGETSICAYDAKNPGNKECKGITENQEVMFEARKYCSSYEYGCTVEFSAEVTKVKYKCAEFDCRYPDQVRLSILTSWTNRSGSSTIHRSIYMLVFLVIKNLL